MRLIPVTNLWQTTLCSLLPALALVTAGCHGGFPTCKELPSNSGPTFEPPPSQYVRVDLNVELKTNKGLGKEEIFASDVFKKNHHSYRTVAIRVPESCLDETAAQKNGQEPGKVILNTTCGAYFSELEKALVKQGYRVISWDRIKNSYNEAVKLGADVVFMVNSLEIPEEATQGSEVNTKLTYYHADEQGNALSEALMTDSNRAVFRTFVERHAEGRELTATGFNVFSCVMDVTAITANNGETVWFYNKTTYEKLEADVKRSQAFLFKGVNGLFWPVSPVGQATGQTPLNSVEQGPTLSAQDISTSVVHSSDSANQYQQRRLKLIRQVVADFVHTFSQPAAGASAPSPQIDATKGTVKEGENE